MNKKGTCAVAQSNTPYIYSCILNTKGLRSSLIPDQRIWLYNLITTAPMKNTSKGNFIYFFLIREGVLFLSTKATLVKSRNTYLKQASHFNWSIPDLIPTFTTLVSLTRTSRGQMWKLVWRIWALSCSKQDNSSTAELGQSQLWGGCRKPEWKSQPAAASPFLLENDPYLREVCCLLPPAYSAKQLACPAGPQHMSFI